MNCKPAKNSNCSHDKKLLESPPLRTGLNFTCCAQPEELLGRALGLCTGP